MKYFSILFLLFLPFLYAKADPPIPRLKVTSRGYGALIGIQKGKYGFFELGAEYHWRKIKLKNPTIFSFGGNMEYNFKYNVIGYKLSWWMKKGRINLTYGLNLCYFTNFEEQRFGGGPAIGFRLLGFHLINGYNFTVGSPEFTNFNNLYITLRYYFPLENKIKFKKRKKKKDNGIFKKD